VGLTLFNCDAQGNVTKEETYDQNGDLEYSALFIYNDKGLAKESNFLGEDFSMKIHSSYDSKGRLLEQEQHSSGQRREYIQQREISLQWS
jgi:hypothetical protein